VEELWQIFRLTIRDEQNIRPGSNLRGFLRALLFSFSFVNDSNISSISFY
jgi:hypothetical protein